MEAVVTCPGGCLALWSCLALKTREMPRGSSPLRFGTRERRVNLFPEHLFHRLTDEKEEGRREGEREPAAPRG